MITANTLIYTSLLIIRGGLQLACSNTSLLLGPRGEKGALPGFHCTHSPCVCGTELTQESNEPLAGCPQRRADGCP